MIVPNELSGFRFVLNISFLTGFESALREETWLEIIPEIKL